jgi:hypothetical protein
LPQIREFEQVSDPRSLQFGTRSDQQVWRTTFFRKPSSAEENTSIEATISLFRAR